ncbi:MAG: hypothetical protein M5U25_20735 [Planctomycetota bacterium]|nr:hypothetical protein [Planctomycetota bacterium]
MKVAPDNSPSPTQESPSAIPAQSGSRHGNKRRKDLGSIPVEIVHAKGRNPANPYSYLTPQERAERIAKLWHEMFQRLET